MFDPGDINEAAFTYYDRLGRLKRYVDDHYSESIPPKTAARIVELESNYFSKFFHEKTGVHFREWLNHVRVTKAIELMKTKNYGITELAFTVGFQDLRTFERSFKSTTHLTPREYKRRVKPC